MLDRMAELCVYVGFLICFRIQNSRVKNIRSCKEKLVSRSFHEPSLVRRGQLCLRAGSGKVSYCISCTHGR